MLDSYYNGPEWDPDSEYEKFATYDEATAPQTIDGDCVRYGLHGCQYVLNLVDSDISELIDCELTHDPNKGPIVAPDAVFTRVPRFRLIIES
jgi:hypothetical protein